MSNHSSWDLYLFSLAKIFWVGFPDGKSAWAVQPSVLLVVYYFSRIALTQDIASFKSTVFLEICWMLKNSDRKMPTTFQTVILGANVMLSRGRIQSDTLFLTSYSRNFI